MPPAPNKPELLAPAGGWPQLRAAVHAGADAVYFGLERFNARLRADNFTAESLPEVMTYLRRHGVRGLVTFNTLVFDRELPAARRELEAIARAGVDAVIVQDLGVLRLIREVVPALPVHASTQTTIASAEGVEWMRQLGAERVVLARELSLREIGEIAEALGDDAGVDLEVFVHGALCVSYSGQCFSSEAWGGRSANRGECAQACRLPYDMVVDGARVDLGDLRYVLSPQDLMALERVPELIEAGVACFKIEGRLKGVEYVAAATAAYRSAIDAAWEARVGGVAAGRTPSQAGREAAPPSAEDLEQLFSRGFTPGFLDGVRHQVLVEGLVPRHRGRHIGTVTAVRRDEVEVALRGPVKRGDGLVFDPGAEANADAGGRVYEVLRRGERVDGEVSEGRVALRFANDFALGRVRAGMSVWRTRDEGLEGRIRSRLAGEPARRVVVTALVSGRDGEPLRLRLRDAEGREGVAESAQALSAARNRALDEESLREPVGRLGDTPFALGELRCELEGALFLPVSELNAVRRAAAEALDVARARPPRWAEAVGLGEQRLSGPLGALLAGQGAGLDAVGAEGRGKGEGRDVAPALVLLCRTFEQVRAALDETDVGAIVLDFLEVKGVAEAVAAVRAAGREATIASPRILKHREERIWRFLLGCEADALLVRSPGLLVTLAQRAAAGEAGLPRLRGDFSLNAANALAADLLLGMGLERVTPTHDLNAVQIGELVAGLSRLGHGAAPPVEVVLHHHLPIFHTEHCVFARFLSDGNDFRDCGRPCERHDVALEDAAGRRHSVLADMGCRNTVFNAEAQSGARYLGDLVDAGVRWFRVELVAERGAEVGPLVGRYQRALREADGGQPLWDWLVGQPGGVTEGSLAVTTRKAKLRPTARGAAGRGGVSPAGS